MGKTLAGAFDRKLNSLNAIRLVLAAGVVFWHSYPLTGRTVDWRPAHQLLAEVWVDGFFAISGFLIVGSWLNSPEVGRYLKARLLRIMPAFYVCLIVTALVIAPVGALMSGGPLYSTDSVSYVIKNAFLWIFQFDIAGTIEGVPYPNVWNGSLWTLAWEFLCYLAVLGLGVVGLLKKPATLPLVFAGAWLILLATSSGLIESELVQNAARFGLVFTAGGLVYLWQSKLLVSPALVAGAFAVTVAASALPDYRLVAAPFLAYALIGLGALVKDTRRLFRNDLSYGLYIYAFPVQQILALTGLALLPVGLFALAALACALILAAGSWFLIEKPALRFKPRTAAPVTVLT